MAISERAFGELLGALAERTPAPGAGAAAACAGALAAGLVEMAARFAGEHEPLAATELRALLLELADAELRAYQPLLAALRLPREDPARPERVAAARTEATAPPLEIARACSELAALGARLVLTGNPNLEGDALAGCLLAESACRAAARLVEINLLEDPEQPRVREARELAERALEQRRRALSD